METMSHRERVLRALNHQEPDRVPLDLGGSRSSSLVVETYERLNRHLGSQEPLRIFSKWLNVAHPSQVMLQRFDIDFRSISLGDPDNWEDIVFPDGSYQDEWGVVRSRPAGSLYYDLTKPPLASDADVADLEKFRWPDPHDPGRCRGLAEAAARLHQGTDYAVVLGMPGGIVHQAQFLRGFEDWFADLIANPAFFQALMEKLADLWIEMAKDELDAVGCNVDICFLGDDMAFQNGPMMSMDLYRKMIKPHHKRLFSYIRSRTSAKIAYHTCGSVVHLIPDLIEMGVDALNPVQVSARGMDTEKLKQEFGKDICFWGAIDTQRVMPFGKPDAVAHEVRQRIDTLAPGGGYLLCAVHNIQADVSPENICAMYDTARDYGRY
ncbi:MAG TPA: uroporphyrinogen decarboxylase family protein [Candidatus Methylomirabilis sp.]|nr:uroporphyrinogen decarboxylase family protein [Candidatus Methylomirabilis sp.]